MQALHCHPSYRHTHRGKVSTIAYRKSVLRLARVPTPNSTGLDVRCRDTFLVLHFRTTEGRFSSPHPRSINWIYILPFDRQPHLYLTVALPGALSNCPPQWCLRPIYHLLLGRQTLRRPSLVPPQESPIPTPLDEEEAMASR